MTLAVQSNKLRQTHARKKKFSLISCFSKVNFGSKICVCVVSKTRSTSHANAIDR